MIYKSLFLLVFANLFNQAYQLANYYLARNGCRVPTEILPAGVTLSPQLELENRVRCYCEVVKAKRAGMYCYHEHVPWQTSARLARLQWVEDNLRCYETATFKGEWRNAPAPLPQRRSDDQR